MVAVGTHQRTFQGAAAVDPPGAHPEAAREASAPSPGESQRPSKPWLRPALMGGTLVLAAILLFTRLGHYVFWDDEAATALGAKAIMMTGTNTALVDHGNIVAFGDGSALQGFDNRIEPLLPSYLTAAMFEGFGMNTWAGRFPFALFGLGTVALMMAWARRESWQVLAVLAMGALGNVAFLLYCRNCRYYAPAIFFSVALAYLYRHRKPTVGSALAFAALSILLFTSNYLNYAAFYVCLSADYFFWQRKRSPLGWRLLLCVLLPQIVINGTVAAIWNPLRTAHAGNLVHNSVMDRLLLFYWQWRDTNGGEQLCLPLLLVTLGVGLAQRRALLVRGWVALAVYMAVVAVLSPQLISTSAGADVRYLTPIIPLAIGLEAVTLCVLLRKWSLPLFGVALLAFGTNSLNAGLLYRQGPRSTLVSYLRELANPLVEPYEAAAAWVNENVREGESVLVAPGYAAYPLMFYAPRALYAWQFSWPPRPEYANLPPIHFAGQVAPDYLVAFGPYLPRMERAIERMKLPDTAYVHVATIKVFWLHTERPEIKQHCFEPMADFPDRYAIHIFKRTTIAPRADGQPEDDRVFPGRPREGPEPVGPP